MFCVMIHFLIRKSLLVRMLIDAQRRSDKRAPLDAPWSIIAYLSCDSIVIIAESAGNLLSIVHVHAIRKLSTVQD